MSHVIKFFRTLAEWIGWFVLFMTIVGNAHWSVRWPDHFIRSSNQQVRP